MVPPDMPDPRLSAAERAARLPFAVYGFVDQPALEDTGWLGLESVGGSHGYDMQAATVSYTLWRNPDDRSDPVNLAALDEAIRAALDDPPPWPRPDWLVEVGEQMRYPTLTEAVRTSWHRVPSERTTLVAQLCHHANHILMNGFREQLGLPRGGPTADESWRVRPSAVQQDVELEVDGVLLPASRIDTDPFVCAIGARVRDDVVVTVVVPRDVIPLVRLAVRTRPAEPPGTRGRMPRLS